jgi:negative regulator of sigma E activity
MQQTCSRSNWVRQIAIVVFVAAVVPAVLFGLRTYDSFLMLCSAYEAGTPMTSSIASLLAGMSQYRLSKFGSVSV